MCRAGNEGPGVTARRCEHGLTHAQFLAKRREDYRNNVGGMRDKAKARYQSSSQKVNSPGQESMNHLLKVWSDEKIIREQEYLTIARKLLDESSPLTDTSKALLDEVFDEENASLHYVQKLHYPSGEVGFFKPLNNGDDEDMEMSYTYFGQQSMQTLTNEVAAYKLTQILGEGFAGLIPETILTTYTHPRVGQPMLGTVQKDTEGILNRDFLQGKSNLEIIGVEQLRKARILDFLMSSQDRHSGNFMHTDVPGAEYSQLSLIDNGFSFSERIYPSIEMHAFDSSVWDDEVDGNFTQSELNSLERLLNDPTSGGMDAYLSEKAYSVFRLRLERLYEAKTCLKFQDELKRLRAEQSAKWRPKR